MLTRDGDEEPAALPTPTATQTVTVTPTPTPTPTPTSSPSATETAGEYPMLMADSLGALRLRMTKAEALNTGLVSEQDAVGRTELVADPDALPGVFVCWDAAADSLTGFTVKDGSPIVTPDGIGVTSTADDLRAAYGVLLQEREENGQTWYVVTVDDVGYAFFPTEVEMVMIAGTDQLIAEVLPGSEPC